MIWRFVDPVGLNMLDSRLLRLLDALASLLFLVAAALIVLLTSQVKYHDGNYPLFYFGFGVLLECVYLAIHFALKTIFSSRASLAARISRTRFAVARSDWIDRSDPGRADSAID
jgi:hypothetical protein